MRLLVVAALAAFVITAAGCSSCNPVPEAYAAAPDCAPPVMAAPQEGPCGPPPAYAKPGEVWCCVPYEVPGAAQRVCVQEECVREVEVPAVYETVTEEVLVAAGRTEWRKVECENVPGTECWSLVEIPAQYETRTKEIMKSPATVRYERVAPRYEMTYGAPQTGYRWELRTDCDIPANAAAVYRAPANDPGMPPAGTPDGFGSVN